MNVGTGCQLCILIFVLFECETLVKSQKRTAKITTPPTLLSVWKRVKFVEKKLTRTQRELKEAQATIVKLQEKVTRIGAGDFGRFRDGAPCPNNLPGFFHAPDFNTCYKLMSSDILVNWTEGKHLCQENHPDAHLVSIETEEEQLYLRARWNQEYGVATIARYWTSGKRMKIDWLWAATDTEIEYANWIPTTTHDDQRFNCIAVYSNEGYFWGDVACWAPHLVTCELNL